MNQKKLLAMLVAGACAIPFAAYADDDDDKGAADGVTLYGKLYPEVVSTRGSGATSAGTTVATIAATPTGSGAILSSLTMQSSNSRLGFRGREGLGSGMTAIWQIESTVLLDEGGGTFGARDTFVGLKGGFGTVRLGNMDTVFKTYGDEVSFLGVSSGNFVSTSNLLRKTGFGTSSASSFHLRRINSQRYDSPNIGGFQFSGQYSSNEAKTATRDPRVFSMGAKYQFGKLEVSLAHEIHNDLFGGSRNVKTSQSNFADLGVNSKDKATQFMIQYRFGAHTFEFDINDKKYNESGTAVTGRFREYHNKSYLFGMENKWSNIWKTAFHYVRSAAGNCSLIGAACNTNGLDGTQVDVGVAYSFSKRTSLFLLYSQLRNGFSARYNNSDLQAPSVGEDIRQAALGLSHSF